MKKIIFVSLYLLAGILSSQAQTLLGTSLTGGNYGGGTIYNVSLPSAELTVAKSLESIEYMPRFSNLLQASDGKMYGMTTRGGKKGYGAIFSYNPLSGTYRKEHDFDDVNGAIPQGSLIQATDGKLYGMTASGGKNSYGVIFSFNIITSEFSSLYEFDNTNGRYPQGTLFQADDGHLYGMTVSGGSMDVGVLFSFDPASLTYHLLKEFNVTNGANPQGTLIQASDGKLYGVTSGGGLFYGGVIFSYDLPNAIFSKSKDLDNVNGASPTGALVEARLGHLYGMTTYDGTAGFGGVFSFNILTSTYTLRHSFNNTDGANPYGTLTLARDGKLYGMTSAGGNQLLGTVFSFDPSDFTFRKLKDFRGKDGGAPKGGLIQASNGKLYGMTSGGGNGYTGRYSQSEISGDGVIFSFDYSSSTYTKVKDMGSNETGTFVRSPTRARNGMLYGMTTSGGTSGAGVIYSWDPASSTYAKLKDFNRTDGANPEGSLVEASDGKLYGMTPSGGTFGGGTLFSFEVNSSELTVLQEFSYTKGLSPYGSLVQASDGKLYGMTSYGGRNSGGVIFSFDPSSSAYTHLYDFVYASGSSPHGTLTEGIDGKLYGITFEGGSKSNGGIFSFDPTHGKYESLKELSISEGGGSLGSLMVSSDGRLFGLARNGGEYNAGVIFSFDPVSLNYNNLHHFDFVNGAFPTGNLMQASDGKLYGTVGLPGIDNAGLVFSFDPETSAFTRLTDLQDQGTLYNRDATFVEITECITKSTYYRDKDNDGFGNAKNDTIACSLPNGYVHNATDCNDADSLVHATAKEICNGLDDNCNGLVDEGVAKTYYQDADKDGYGNSAKVLEACSRPNGYVVNSTDCNDANKTIYPGAKEVCNGFDDNCSGSIDEGFTDTDGDHVADCMDTDDDNDGVPDFSDCAPLDKKKDKVLICHKGNTICVSQSAVAAHLKHGDSRGACGARAITSNNQNTPTNKFTTGKHNLQYSITNFPNPFADRTTIRYELPYDSKVSVKVYDVLGRLIATLVDGDKKAGIYTVEYSSKNASGGSLFYRMVATSKEERFEITNKMIKNAPGP